VDGEERRDKRKKKIRRSRIHFTSNEGTGMGEGREVGSGRGYWAGGWGRPPPDFQVRFGEDEFAVRTGGFQ